ncbi:hypothetical protein [Sulfitobacter sp. JB4-11]|uniref:hypothetical protein n=1 Tax=Sulfitobacter rhodophyticola TaxID=3238304 RepID=UPI003D814224
MTGRPDPVPRPIFLERHSYRRRRLWDGVRILPFLGLILWMVPLLWPLPDEAAGQGVSTSAALLYLFAVWVLLAFVARLLWRGTSRTGMPPN